ncbi:hypothetical protein CHS0354_037546 [Potamilus streckersoni]|uniref:Uncharacterized protein n=1 Tax=Potamilus streckersoni TaxID=2493646 RepID=A0AAE0W941_9BIVA|nr:hypothetical protein CHS0354_037546 [Potamilus streckersoni]
MRYSMDAQTAQEECKLFLAALESYKTGKMTPLLKEELKYQIQSRRLSEGRDELTLDLQADMTIHNELEYVELKKRNSVLREEIKRLSSGKEMMTMIMKNMCQEQIVQVTEP